MRFPKTKQKRGAATALLGSEKGSILVAIVLISGVGLLLIYALSGFMGAVSSTNVKTRGFFHYQTSLHSLMDYTINGIRQKWCFTPTWMESTDCTLFDPNNVERLLLSEESLDAIATSGIPHPAPLSATRAKSISVTTPISMITASHILFQIIRELEDLGVSAIEFNIERVDNYHVPTRGREVILQARVRLILDKVDPRRYPLIETQLAVFPRELATNALLVANDLDLNSASADIAPTPGDSRIPVSPGPSAAVKGVRFESPVFVNGNILLPPESGASYSHVTFVDKVTLGGGSVFQGDVAAKPATAGGPQDRFYTQSRRFGGFLGGVEMDPSRDAGLDYFAGVIPSPVLDRSAVDLCKRRVQARSDLSITRDSQLFTRLNSTSVSGMNSVFKLSLHTGHIDSFKEQNIIPAATSLASALPTPNLNNGGERPIFRVHLSLTGYGSSGATPVFARGDLSANGTFSVRVGPGSGATTPEIVIKTTPYTFPGGERQSNQVQLHVELRNQDRFNVANYSPGPDLTARPTLQIGIEAYDYAYLAGFNNRTDPAAIHPTMREWKTNELSFVRGTDGRFQLVTNGPVATGAWHTCSLLNVTSCTNIGYPVFDPTQIPIDMDYVKFDRKCNVPPSDPNEFYPSFQASDWDVSFAKTARFSWGFTETGTAAQPGFFDGTLNLTAAGGAALNSTAGLYPTFKIHSIVRTCVVTSSANFVAGFFVCDEFIIAPRTTPLRIIGTVIAGKLAIHPTAVAAGIRWSSIYSPTAVYELRNAGILRSVDGISCETPSVPTWHPYPAISHARALYSCNPISLGAKADPFRWTAVDPDCGILDGQGAVTCKKRVTRFAVRELWRKAQ